ncbi:MAG: hypothetical protein WKF75_03885, partial [Singulisphaera sp.]
EGRLGWTKGGRARFFGVSLLSPTAFLDRERADALADRLARSGINLVRLGDLDVPLGPGRSLFDDSRDDTKAFDPMALAKLDHLIAALKARGISVALEIQGARQFRAEDGVAEPGRHPPGGGPAATFDPAMVGLAREAARALLAHVNPETGLALRDDPVLAWVTLAGEVSLFDLIDDLHSLSPKNAAALKTRAQASPHGSGRRFWQATESAHWKELADALRGDGLRVPVAGGSHWRREPEFAAVQGAPGLDLIDDRLYWNAPPWLPPERRSILWSLDGGLAAGARGSGGPTGPMWSASGATRRSGRGHSRTRAPTSCWPRRRPRPRTGTPWSAAASSSIPRRGDRTPSGRAAWRTSSSSPRWSTASPRSSRSCPMPRP